jgi:RNA recognition motif-containing protein
MVIFVANLNFKLQEQQLQKLFEEHGAVTSVRIIMDRHTGRSKGYGFVEMADDSQANAAMEALNGVELEGKPLAVKEARPRTENAPRRSNYREGGNFRGGDRGPRYGGNRSHDQHEHDDNQY